jgi:hypothetical protein
MKKQQTTHNGAEYAENVDRQRGAAWRKVRERRFAAAFPTEEARLAYLELRINQCSR